MHTPFRFFLYLHSSAIATLLCVFLITACADPVRDAIKTAEKFAAAKDFDEAIRTLDRAPFKTPDEKQRIAEAKDRVMKAVRVAFVEESVSSAEAMWPNLAPTHPFRGLGDMPESFTPGTAFRYNKLVMRNNIPVEECLERKRENSILLCERPMEYVMGAALVDEMVARAARFAERGNLTSMHCTHYFIVKSLGAYWVKTERMKKTSEQMSRAAETIGAKLKLTAPELDDQYRIAERGCTPDVVFGKI